MTKDITDKLSFDENPTLKVKGEVIEVQADAMNVLKIMGLFDGEKSESKATLEAAEMLFSKKDREKIKGMKLQFKDYVTLVQEAINIAVSDEEEGEK